MRISHWASMFVIAALAYGAGWWSREGVPAATPASSADPAVRANAGPGSAESGPALPESGSSRTARVAAVELDRVVTRLASAQASAAHAARPGPDITGRVLDERGRPVPGVLVRAEPDVEEDSGPDWQIVGYEPEPDRPLGDLVRELLATESRRRAGRREATTGPDGGYRITGLAAGAEYDLDASLARHFVWADDDSDSDGVRPGAVVGFVARPLGAVRLSLELPDGTAPAAACVTLQREGSRYYFDWDPSHALVQQIPGDWSFTLTAPGYRGEAGPVEVGALETVAVTIRLAPVHEIRVSVRWPEGLGRNRIEIRATQDESADGRYDDPEADVEGDTAVFRELSPGKWWIRAQYPSDRIACRELADTTGGPAELRWTLPPPDARDFVMVRVLDPAGNPVEDAVVESSSGYFRTGVDSRDVRPVGPGLFRVTHAHRFDLEDASFYIVVKSEAHGTRRAAYRAGFDESVSIRFPPSAPLTVRVPGKGDRYVRVRPVVADPGIDDMTGFADEIDRSLRFEHVPAGAYEIHSYAHPGTAMRVTIPCDGPVVYEGSPCRAWAVEDVAADGAAAAAGLRNGDRIVGVDGTDFTDEPHRKAVWEAALTRESFDIDLIRDGALVRIRLTSAAVRDRETFGASLSAALR